MMSLRVEITQAVLDELCAAVAGGKFGNNMREPKRSYEPVYDLTDAKTTHITVIARSFTSESNDRSRQVADVEVDIAIQKKISSTDAAEIDPLGDLVERVVAFFQRRRLATYPNAICTKVSNSLLYIPEHLLEKRLFTSVVTLSYRVIGA